MISKSVTNDFFFPFPIDMWKYLYFLHDGIDLHINTYWPVNHGSVASVHMDADAIAGFGVPGTTDCMQTLSDADGDHLNEFTILRETLICGEERVELTATKSTFFSVDFGMVNGSHRS